MLREGATPGGSAGTMVKAVDDAIARSTLKADTPLYRGISFEEGDEPDWLANLSQGTVIEDLGYVSTSTRSDSAREFAMDDTKVLFQILAPAGTNALDVHNHPDLGGEAGTQEGEVLLPRGTKFEVTEVDTDGDTTVVSARVVSDTADVQIPAETKEEPDAVPEASAPDVEGPGSGTDPQPDFPGPTVGEAAGAQDEGDEVPDFIRPFLTPGDKVYVHPQGAALIVSPDGAVVKYGPDGKPRKSSATAAKLAVGHGQWKPVQVAKAKPAPAVVTPDTDTKPLTDSTPAAAVVVAAPEPELPSVPAPKTAKHRVPMTFEEVSVSTVPQYIDDDKFFFQQKVDGIRGQLVIEPGKEPWFRSKSGQKLVNSSAAKITGPMLKAIGTQPEGGGPAYTVDGELLDGKWYVFDVTVEGNESVPWSDRMSTAEAWVNEMHKAGLTQIQALPTARTADEKRALWEAVRDGGGEGVMIKRKDAPYNYGSRVTHTVKAKVTATADVVVLERNREGKENAVIGVNIDGKMTEIGTVSMQGKEKFGNKVSVGDVVEVEYLWAMPGTNSLQQPRYKKSRPDKKQDEATLDQFRYVDKSVVEIDTTTDTVMPAVDPDPQPVTAPVFNPPYALTPKHLDDADRSEVKPGSMLESFIQTEYLGRQNLNKSYLQIADADELWEEAYAGLREQAIGDGVGTYIATPADRMVAILNDGRMKSAHEAKTTGGQVTGYMQARRWFEKHVMGVGGGKNVPVKQRPVYGYRSKSAQSMDNYGRVNIRLKPEAEERTTITFDDSLNEFLTPIPLAEVADLDAKDAWQNNHARASWHVATPYEYGPNAGQARPREEQVKNLNLSAYIETQIHGGVTVDDIESITVDKSGTEKEVTSLLASRHVYYPPSEWKKLYDAAVRERDAVDKMIAMAEEMGIDVTVK